MKRKLFIFALAVLMAAAVSPLLADRKGTRQSTGVIIDTGDTLSGFNVTLSTAATTLISQSGTSAHVLYRLRTFQVTGTAYNVWMTTYTPAVWNSGAGWLVYGSTGAYTTRSQAAVYGVLDPAAGSGTAVIHGPYEYQRGEVPNQ